MRPSSLLRALTLCVAGIALVTGCALPELSLGDTSGGGAPPTTPVDTAEGVQAFGAVFEMPRGDDRVTVAQLAVFGVVDGELQWSSGVANPIVQTAGAEFPLATTQDVGVFATTSEQQSALRYDAGVEYRFAFSLLVAGEEPVTIEAAVTTPDSPWSFSLPPGRNEGGLFLPGEPIEVTLDGIADGTIRRVVEVTPSPRETYRSFVLDAPDALVTSRESVVSGVGPLLSIPGDAFPEPGTYDVEIGNLAVATAGDESVSEQLGSASFFVAGEVFAETIEVD